MRRRLCRRFPVRITNDTVRTNDDEYLYQFHHVNRNNHYVDHNHDNDNNHNNDNHYVGHDNDNNHQSLHIRIVDNCGNIRLDRAGDHPRHANRDGMDSAIGQKISQQIQLQQYEESRASDAGRGDPSRL